MAFTPGGVVGGFESKRESFEMRETFMAFSLCWKIDRGQL